MQFLGALLQGVFLAVWAAMSLIGIADGWWTGLLNFIGVQDSDYQFYALLMTTVFVVMLSMRSLGGYAGWFVMLFMVLLLLDRMLPPSHYNPNETGETQSALLANPPAIG
ncbi:hypothetical protein [Acidocella sp.]|uniref:hypothetical protein n=1 Tax=Acidocella sp. TaxID=50710 RepID=UPI002625E80D|nr:hypothetical protein [Acidocella sp.]